MSRRRGPRGLRPDETDLWNRVASTATPLQGRARATPALQPGKPPPKPQEPETPAPDLSEFAFGSRAQDTAPYRDVLPSLSDHLARQPVRMDAKAFGRLKRGKMPVERRIDLHGMTLAAAHPSLIRFVLDAHADGKRLLLVITGKGRERDELAPMPVRRGILKHQVPQWLRSGPLGALVLQVSEAHRSHGGSGAYYVYLRRGSK